MRNPALFALANRRYSTMFTADNEQIPHFAGPIVSDVDDPLFTPAGGRAAAAPESEGVRRHRRARGPPLPGARRRQALPRDPAGDQPQLGDGRAGRRGGRAPGAGRGRRRLDGRVPAQRRRPRRRGRALQRRPPARALGRDPRAAARAAGSGSSAEASERVRQRVEGRDDIVLFGRLRASRRSRPPPNFDIALYPRTKDMGIQAAKVGEFIGLGVPTVSYDYEVTENLRETGAGVLVPTPREFVDAVVRLGRGRGGARSSSRPPRSGRAPTLDWDVLARRYEDEILDRYLPPASRGRAPARAAAAAGGRALPARSGSKPNRQSAQPADQAPGDPERQQLEQRVRLAPRARRRRGRPTPRRRPGATGLSAAQANVADAKRRGGRDEHGHDVQRARPTSVTSVLSATPQMPTVEASTTERTTFATPAPTSTRAISCCRARAIRNCVTR